MATIELSFTALPAHVRTARLVATTVARRTGVAESMLDEVRLAVGEACSRAVEAHRTHCPGEPVRMELRDDPRRFEVVVIDVVPNQDSVSLPDGASEQSLVPHSVGGPAAGEWPPHLGLAMIAGLADDVEFSSTADGLRIQMSWPAATEPAQDSGARP